MVPRSISPSFQDAVMGAQPNLFNPSTQLVLDLRTEALHGLLEFFDLSGRRQFRALDPGAVTLVT